MTTYRFEVTLEADTSEEAVEELRQRIEVMAEEIEGEDKGEDEFDPRTHGSFYELV